MSTTDDRNDWQYEVANGDTVLGFQEWMEHKQETDEASPAEDDPLYEYDTLDVQGVCKDCNSGTLNNRLHEAFDFNGNEVYCLNCGSTHLDLL